MLIRLWGLTCLSSLLRRTREKQRGRDTWNSNNKQRATTEHSKLEFKQGDALNLSRDLDNDFDLVVIADTLYYLSPLSDEVLQTVRERVVQLLGPGGILLLVNHFTLNLSPGSRWGRKSHRV